MKNKNNKLGMSSQLEAKQKIRSSFPIPTRDSVLVCTLGGVGQIGMNWTLYGYDGKWVLVDAGSSFAPRDVDGVDAIIPDISCLRGIKLSGLIVTHAHEDHIGAIHRLWPTLKCPIYATPFASEILRNRFADADTLGSVTIKTYTPGNRLGLGGMVIDTIRMTHSVPECVSLVFNTPVGKVFHTGDWKFDPHPLIGRPTNMRALEALGASNDVIAMICDSTNADRHGSSTSERDVANGMFKVFRDARGMVLVSCFSTNVARLASVAKAAAATGRHVALAGRSLIRTEAAARSVGLLDGVPEFLADVRHLKGLDRREMVLLCTGAQGEPNAAMSRYAEGDNWRLPSVSPNDTVIHSARVIPGNETDLYEVFDRLKEQGVSVLENEYRGSPLHVTGHAVANEIEEMYGLVRPRFALPVHGEDHHLAAHTDIALRSGVSKVLVPGEGDVFAVNQTGINKIAKVDVELVAELSGSERGIFVPWNKADPHQVYDHIPQSPAMVA